MTTTKLLLRLLCVPLCLASTWCALANQPPVISPLTVPGQTILEDTTLALPFSVADENTAADGFTFNLSSSDLSLVPTANMVVSGSGTNKTLSLRGVQHMVGSANITLQVVDRDGASSTRVFGVTITSRNVPTLSAVGFSGSIFQVGLNGPSGLTVEIRRSDDLVNWTVAGSVTLGSGVTIFLDSVAENVTHRFYTASSPNGCAANVVGFAKVTVPSGQKVCLANPFNSADDRLCSVLANVPPGAEFYKHAGGSFTTYSFDELDEIWIPTGDVSFAPGEAGEFRQITGNPVTIVFKGDVQQGLLANSIPAGYSLRSSILPKAGGLASALQYQPQAGDQIIAYRSGSQVTYTLDNSLVWTPSEPSFAIGEGFMVYSPAARQWNQEFSACCVTPVLSSGQFVSASEFQFGVSGTDGAYVKVYSSSDLTSWTLRDTLLLNGGVGAYSDSQVSGIPHRFYRVTHGDCCSEPIGFTRTTVAANSYKLIANQLDTPPNTLNSLLPNMPAGVALHRYVAGVMTTYTSDGSGWQPNGNTVTFAPGEGALFQNTTGQALTAQFIGKVKTGQLTKALPTTAQNNTVSSMAPHRGLLTTDLGFPATPGDTVHLFRNGSYIAFAFDEFDNLWYPTEPLLEVGESFLFSSGTTSPRNWMQNVPSCGGTTNAIPHSRGKVLLVVDQTMSSNTVISTKLERLTQDMVADGWRVLRHNVPRGARLWEPINATLVRQVKALIKADYDADPSNVKAVFLVGHVPVPYSGLYSINNGSGGHYNGAGPADGLYAEMRLPYGAGGWTDVQTELAAGMPQFDNLPGDGKFDQTHPLGPFQLAHGRVDLSDMPAFLPDSEAILLSRYLEKDHDWRFCGFRVRDSGFSTGLVSQQGLFCEPWATYATVIGPFLGTQRFLNHCTLVMDWFPNVGRDGQEKLFGYGGGWGGNTGAQHIGTTGPGEPESAGNNFVENDSRVVFVNLYGSMFGAWDRQNNFLKAPLCNAYDPVNNRFGYGLAARWSEDLDPNAMSNLFSGGLVGDTPRLENQDLLGMMGDPTLRIHPMAPPSGLVVSNTGSAFVLTWADSPDSCQYYIYRAPTSKGPFLKTETGGPIPTTNYTAIRNTTGDPDNFYMVRAVRTEVAANGLSYANMSEGIIAPVPSNTVPFLRIISQPADQEVAPQYAGIDNAVAFTVDALGCDANCNEQLSYQWYKNGVALTDNARFHGTATRAFYISQPLPNDTANYSVVVSRGSLTATSAAASLVVSETPSPVADSYSIYCNEFGNFSVLDNDSDDGGNPALRLFTLSAISPANSGTATILPDGRTVKFVPTRTFRGVATFTYYVSDGISTAPGTVTVNVQAIPWNQAPVVTPASIAAQTSLEDTTIDVPFTVTDDLTPADNLIISAVCSDSSLVPTRLLTFTGSGQNRVLRVKGTQHQVGSGTITLTVKDEDDAFTTRSFPVNYSPRNIPTLLASGFDGTIFQVGLNGPSGLAVEIRRSDDLVNWTVAGSVTLGSGVTIFLDSVAENVTQRFYTASSPNGCAANVVGFAKVTVPSGQKVYLANPFHSADDRLCSVLANVPPGAEFYKYSTYLFDELDEIWTPTGDVSFAPGEPGEFRQSTGNPVTIVFKGDVQQGLLANSIPAGYSLRSSILPKAGGLASALQYQPQAGDQIIAYRSGSQVTYTLDNSLVWTPSEPSFAIGEGFLINSSTARQWNQEFSACCVTPVLSSGQFVSASEFQFGVSGTDGAYVKVYSSSDLTSWTLRDTLLLSGGVAAYSDNQVSGISHRFYRVTHGDCCSEPIGFTRTTVAANSYKLIANQLDTPPNTLNSLLPNMPAGVALHRYVAGVMTTYTSDGSGWQPNGNTVTLAPGEGAQLQNTTGQALTAQFIGKVKTGELTKALPTTAQNNTASSMVPEGGLLSTALGFPAAPGDTVRLFRNGSYITFIFDEFDNLWYPTEPLLEVGESFLFSSGTTSPRNWMQNVPLCP